MEDDFGLIYLSVETLDLIMFPQNWRLLAFKCGSYRWNAYVGDDTKLGDGFTIIDSRLIKITPDMIDASIDAIVYAEKTKDGWKTIYT